MEKAINYIVECTESNSLFGTSFRITSFDSARQARSYFRVCMEYYKNMGSGHNLNNASVGLLKEFENGEYSEIDLFSRDF